jgi:hypothetical protein
MAEERITELKARAGKAFSREGLLSLWQEIALNFYPQRANFTTEHYHGKEYASHLATSHTVRCHRDLSNAIGSMLRPDEIEWFKARPKNAALRKHQPSVEWCAYATKAMREVMFDVASRFTKATTQTDKDYVAFGQGCLTLEMNSKRDSPLFRCWHPRDVAWLENDDAVIDTVFRKWKISARNLAKKYPKTVDPKVHVLAKEAPDQIINCMHIVMPSEDYAWAAGKKKPNTDRFPWACVYLDCDNDTVLSETPMRYFMWVIPRWSTVSDNQYAYSDASDSSIADARTLQSMADTMLEQGERAVDPPIVARREMFQSPFNLYPGGVTYADVEGDATVKDNIVPLPGAQSGDLSSGVEMMVDMRQQIADGFYLNRLFLPPYDPGDKMTAAEVARRTQEFIRQAMPIFKPIEEEYNNPLVVQTFWMLFYEGGFNLETLPEELMGQDIEFTFISPLKEASERADVDRFGEATQLTAMGVALDPAMGDNFNSEEAYRTAMAGLGAPPSWVRDKKEVAAIRKGREQKQQLQQAAQMLQTGGEVAEQVGKGAAALKEGLGPDASQMIPGAAGGQMLQ